MRERESEGERERERESESERKSERGKERERERARERECVYGNVCEERCEHMRSEMQRDKERGGKRQKNGQAEKKNERIKEPKDTAYGNPQGLWVSLALSPSFCLAVYPSFSPTSERLKTLYMDIYHMTLNDM